MELKCGNVILCDNILSKDLSKFNIGSQFIMVENKAEDDKIKQRYGNLNNIRHAFLDNIEASVLYRFLTSESIVNCPNNKKTTIKNKVCEEWYLSLDGKTIKSNIVIDDKKDVYELCSEDRVFFSKMHDVIFYDNCISTMFKEVKTDIVEIKINNKEYVKYNFITYPYNGEKGVLVTGLKTTARTNNLGDIYQIHNENLSFIINEDEEIIELGFSIEDIVHLMPYDKKNQKLDFMSKIRDITDRYANLLLNPHKQTYYTTMPGCSEIFEPLYTCGDVMGYYNIFNCRAMIMENDREIHVCNGIASRVYNITYSLFSFKYKYGKTGIHPLDHNFYINGELKCDNIDNISSLSEVEVEYQDDYGIICEHIAPKLGNKGILYDNDGLRQEFVYIKIDDYIVNGYHYKFDKEMKELEERYKTFKLLTNDAL